MARLALAVWRGPTPNQGGPMLEQRGVVLHIAEGTFEGTIAWCKNPISNVSAHFVVAADGRIAQLIDTDVTAWTQIAGNGHWLSVENEGHTPNALTAAQVEANAQILAWAHLTYGVPFVVAISPNDRGLGHHSMGTDGGEVPTDKWTGSTWGHTDCPGPAIIAQKPAIVARAAQIVGAPSGLRMEESEMYAFKEASTSAVYVSNGLRRRSVEWQSFGVLCSAGFVTQPAAGAHVDGVGASAYVLVIPDGLADLYGGPLDVESTTGLPNPAPEQVPVDLTDAAVAKVATAVVDEEHTRLAD